MLSPFTSVITSEELLFEYMCDFRAKTRDLHLSRNTLYLLSPRHCFFIVLKRDLFVYRNDSLAS